MNAWKQKTMWICVLALVPALLSSAVAGRSITPSAVSEQAASAAVALTLSQAISSIEGLVRQLEQSARSLIEQGNTALAQQQMTLAGAIRAMITQLEKAYADSLQKTADQLTTVEKNVRDDLLRISRDLQDSIKLGSSELQSRIYQTQTTANQLFDKSLPLTSRAPLLYGFQTRDILGAFESSPADIEVLGYLLADPDLKYRKPDVQVEGQPISADNVTVQEGRVQIRLSEPLKQSIRLGSQPCSPIRPFRVSLRSYYLAKGGWFSGMWRMLGSAATADLSAQVSPGTRAYDVLIQLDGTRSEDAVRDHTFDNASAQVNFGCGESRSALATWTVPKGSTDVNITKCEWRNHNNAKGLSATPAIGGLTATCNGGITGLDNNRGPFGVDLGCPGGGHGEVYLAGTYKLSEHVTSPFVHKNTSTLIGADVNFTIPTETGLTWKTLKVEVRRKQCGEVLDEATIEMPSGNNERKQQTSKNGLFSITWQQSTLTVSGTSRLAGL